MAAFVLDASAAVAGLSPDEAHAACGRVVERALVEEIAVPEIWPYEAANILTLKVRRGPISARGFDMALRSIRDFRLAVASFEPASEAFVNAVDLASKHRLTVYDAAYLELAMRWRLPLASLDKALATAARDAGVVIL